MTTGNGLKDQRPEFEYRQFLEFSLLHIVQTGSEAHPVAYPLGTGGSSPELQRPEREADHSPPTSAEVKNSWSYTSTSLNPSWREESFTLYTHNLV
jgi:hypothetical protein